MQLEAGKTYRTRDGGTTGPLVKSSCDPHWLDDKSTPGTFSYDPRYTDGWRVQPGADHPRDIIGPVVEADTVR